MPQYKVSIDNPIRVFNPLIKLNWSKAHIWFDLYTYWMIWLYAKPLLVNNACSGKKVVGGMPLWVTAAAPHRGCSLMELWLLAQIDHQALMLKKFWFHQIRSHSPDYRAAETETPSQQDAAQLLHHDGGCDGGRAGGGVTNRTPRRTVDNVNCERRR